MKLLIRDSYKRVRNSQLGKDVFYVFIAQVMIMVSVFCINKIIGVFIGVAGFGLFSLIKRAGGVLCCVQKGGITIALPRYLARFSKSPFSSLFYKNLLYTSSMIMGGFTVFTILLYVSFPATFNRLLFQEYPVERILIWATFLFSFGQAASNLVYSYYQGIGLFKQYNKVQIISSLICLSFTFVFRQGITDLIIGSYTALSIFAIIMLIIELKKLRKVPLHRCLLKKSLFSLLPYGISRMGHELVSLLRDVLPLSIILYRFNMESVGLYSAALSVPLAISPLFAFTGGIFLQRISTLYKVRDIVSIKRLLNSALCLFLVVALLGTTFLILLRRPLMHLFYSSTFDGAIELSVFFSLSLIPRAIYLLYQNPLDAISAKPYNLIVVTLSTILLLALLSFATTLNQCAIAYLISSIITALLTLLFWHLHIKKTYFGKHSQAYEQ